MTEPGTPSVEVISDLGPVRLVCSPEAGTENGTPDKIELLGPTNNVRTSLELAGIEGVEALPGRRLIRRLPFFGNDELGRGTIVLYLDPQMNLRRSLKETVKDVPNVDFARSEIDKAVAVARKPAVREEQASKALDAYDASSLAQPDQARERAQRGFTVAGAIAAALTGAGAIANLSGANEIVGLVGLAALFFWVLAAIIYLSAVTFAKPRQLVNWDDSGAIVARLIDSARLELGKIERRARRARAVTYVAVVLTVVAVGVSFYEATYSDEEEQERIYMRAAGRELLNTVCTAAPSSPPVGAVTFEGEYVMIKFERGECKSEPTEIRVARKSFLGTASP